MAITRLIHPNLAYFVHSDTAIAGTAVTIAERSVTIYYIRVDNSANGAASYLKFYFINTPVTVGTTVPDEVILLPASTIVNRSMPGGLIVPTGLIVACTTAGGTSGSTSPSSSVPLQVTYL
jgi:hypothetical protein